MDLDNSTDNETSLITGNGDTSPVANGPLPSSNRRRFTRNAIAGSAVLLSLGNRGAWGAQVDPTQCMSVTTLNSFDPDRFPERGFASQPPGGINKDGHSFTVADEIHRLSGYPTHPATAEQYTTTGFCPNSTPGGPNTVPVTCQIENTDTICIIRQNPTSGIDPQNPTSGDGLDSKYTRQVEWRTE